MHNTGVRFSQQLWSLLQRALRPPVLKSLVTKPHKVVTRLLQTLALRLRPRHRHLRRQLRLCRPRAG